MMMTLALLKQRVEGCSAWENDEWEAAGDREDEAECDDVVGEGRSEIHENVTGQVFIVKCDIAEEPNSAVDSQTDRCRMINILSDPVVTRDVLVDFKELHLTGHCHRKDGYALQDTAEIPKLNIRRPLIVIVERVEGLDDSL